MPDPAPLPATICPSCRRPSWNSNDAVNRFCAACGWYDDFRILPSWLYDSALASGRSMRGYIRQEPAPPMAPE